MMNCRAAVFEEAGHPLRIQSFERPTLKPHEVLVRIECSTICGSDLHTYEGRRQEPTPTILGHEVIGVVESVGAEPPDNYFGQRVAVGDRVTWSLAVSCFDCDRCGRGLPQKCRKLTKYGHALATGSYALSGGFANYVLLQRGTSIFPLPADADPLVFCPANCATATVMACYSAAGDCRGRRVVILGAGMLGLTAAAFAAFNHAAEVVVVDADAKRLEAAKNFGASRVFHWDEPSLPSVERLTSSLKPDPSGSTADTGFDIVLELSGAHSANVAALSLANIGGSVVLAGAALPTPPIELTPEYVIRHQLTIRGVHNYAPEHLGQALEFLHDAQNQFPFRTLVQGRFDLDQVNEAFEFMRREAAPRVAIYPA